MARREARRVGGAPLDVIRVQGFGGGPATSRLPDIDVTLERWPVVVTVVRGPITDEGLERVETVLGHALARGEPYVAITDATRAVSLPTAATRRRMAEWNAAHRALIERHNVASGIAVTSSLMRAALTAIHWLAPPPSPIRYVPTLADALDFALAKWRERGLAVPDGVHGFRDTLVPRARPE